MKNIFCLLIIVATFPDSIFSQKIDNQLTAKEKRKGWILLFNGVDSEGWTTTNNKAVFIHRLPAFSRLFPQLNDELHFAKFLN